MRSKDLPTLSDSMEVYLNKPYGGLFGSSVVAQVVEEIVSDPTMDYRPGYLEELTGASAPSIREALATLVDLGLLKKGNETGRHPVYRVNVASKKFAALSLLAYAILDDRDGTDCMAEAVHDYYSKVVRENYEPIAIATTAYYSPVSLPGMPGSTIRIGPGMYSGSV
jgi:DNA-binding IclR family transcriptional regulator